MQKSDLIILTDMYDNVSTENYFTMQDCKGKNKSIYNGYINLMRIVNYAQEKKLYRGYLTPNENYTIKTSKLHSIVLDSCNDVYRRIKHLEKIINGNNESKLIVFDNFKRYGPLFDIMFYRQAKRNIFIDVNVVNDYAIYQNDYRHNYMTNMVNSDFKKAFKFKHAMENENERHFNNLIPNQEKIEFIKFDTSYTVKARVISDLLFKMKLNKIIIATDDFYKKISNELLNESTSTNYIFNKFVCIYKLLNFETKYESLAKYTYNYLNQICTTKQTLTLLILLKSEIDMTNLMSHVNNLTNCTFYSILFTDQYPNLNSFKLFNFIIQPKIFNVFIPNQKFYRYSYKNDFDRFTNFFKQRDHFQKIKNMNQSFENVNNLFNFNGFENVKYKMEYNDDYFDNSISWYQFFIQKNLMCQLDNSFIQFSQYPFCSQMIQNVYEKFLMKNIYMDNFGDVILKGTVISIIYNVVQSKCNIQSKESCTSQ
ncbi:hypothetical protein A3Q56_08022, partial [Intoshia linei]